MTDWSALSVMISGAPGSGEAALGALLADRLRIQHIDRDFVANGLRLTVQLGVPSSSCSGHPPR